MNAELYLNDTSDDNIGQDFGSGWYGTLTSMIGRFDQFKKDAELPSQRVSPEIYCAENLEAYRVTPILREIERCDFYLYRSDDEQLIVNLTPPKSVYPTKHQFLSRTHNVASGLVKKGFRYLPRTRNFKNSVAQKLSQLWRLQADEGYCLDGLKIVEQEVNEFRPSDKLVNLVLQSRQEMLLEQDKVLEMLRNELNQDEFTEIRAALNADSANSKLQDEEVRLLIEQEVRLFVETIGNLGFDHDSAKHFLLTKDHASKFLPSIEDALLLPFHLTTDSKPPFLHHLLNELKPIAATGAFCTAHGKLTILKGELVLERQVAEPFDLFFSDTRIQHYVD